MIVIIIKSLLLSNAKKQRMGESRIRSSREEQKKCRHPTQYTHQAAPLPLCGLLILPHLPQPLHDIDQIIHKRRIPRLAVIPPHGRDDRRDDLIRV